MKKYLISITAVLVIVASLCVCVYINSLNTEEVISFNEMIREVNQERKTLLESETSNDIQKYTYSVTGYKEGFTDEEIEMLLSSHEVLSDTLSKEQALEDAEYLFRLLKYVYAGYGYYGGDKVFDQAKEKVINTINKDDKISIEELNKIFLKNLSFIKDGHFVIGNTNVNREHVLNYYCNQDIEIRKNNNGYYYLVDNEKRYIKAINSDKEIEKYLKLSINEDGVLVYYIGLLQNDANATDLLQIEYEINSKINKEDIQLTKVLQEVHEDATAFEQKMVEGIPVLTVRLFFDKIDEISLKHFSESGLDLKNEKVIIIDLRGNQGGSSMWGEFWFENYTDVVPNTGMSSAERYSKFYLYDMKAFQENGFESYFNDVESLLKKYNEPKLNEEMNSWVEEMNQTIKNKAYDTWEVDSPKGEWVNNENIIFVLIDKGIASSSEDFVNMLRTLDNVIFVGSNTSGCSEIGNVSKKFLPNSNILLYFGGELFINKNIESVDGVGYEPDLWLDNQNTVERVIKLCDYYKLK